MAQACSADLSCQAFATNGNLKVKTHMSKFTVRSPRTTPGMASSWSNTAGIPAKFYGRLGHLSKCCSMRWALGENPSARCVRLYIILIMRVCLRGRCSHATCRANQAQAAHSASLGLCSTKTRTCPTRTPPSRWVAWIATWPQLHEAGNVPTNCEMVPGQPCSQLPLPPPNGSWRQHA